MRRYWRSMKRHRRSAWRHWSSLGVSGDIADCGVGITPQMCNRVTNHGDVGTFSKPVQDPQKTCIFNANHFLYALREKVLKQPIVAHATWHTFSSLVLFYLHLIIILVLFFFIFY